MTPLRPAIAYVRLSHPYPPQGLAKWGRQRIDEFAEQNGYEIVDDWYDHGDRQYDPISVGEELGDEAVVDLTKLTAYGHKTSVLTFLVIDARDPWNVNEEVSVVTIHHGAIPSEPESDSE